MLQIVFGRPCTWVSLLVAQRRKGLEESFTDLTGDDETVRATDISLSEFIGETEERKRV